VLERSRLEASATDDPLLAGPGNPGLVRRREVALATSRFRFKAPKGRHSVVPPLPSALSRTGEQQDDRGQAQDSTRTGGRRRSTFEERTRRRPRTTGTCGAAMGPQHPGRRRHEGDHRPRRSSTTAAVRRGQRLEQTAVRTGSGRVPYRRAHLRGDGPRVGGNGTCKPLTPRRCASAFQCGFGASFHVEGQGRKRSPTERQEGRSGMLAAPSRPAYAATDGAASPGRSGRRLKKSVTRHGDHKPAGRCVGVHAQDRE